MSEISESQDQASNTRGGNGGIIPPAEHRWRPGQSGNPGGRPKGQSITARLRELLDAPALDTEGNPIEGMTLGDQIAEALALAAAAGDIKAIKEFLDRTEGRTIAVDNRPQAPTLRDGLEEAERDLNIADGTDQ